MSEQGVQEGTEHAALRGPHVEDQCGGCVVTYHYHLGAAHQEVHDQPLVLLTLRERLLLYCQDFELPIGSVVVVGEQGVQEGTKRTPLRGHRVESQHGGCVVACPHHQGVARQEVQVPVAEGGVQSQGS